MECDTSFLFLGICFSVEVRNSYFVLKYRMSHRPLVIDITLPCKKGWRQLNFFGCICFWFRDTIHDLLFFFENQRKWLHTLIYI